MYLNIGDVGNKARTLTHELGHVLGWFFKSDKGIEPEDRRGHPSSDGKSMIPGIMTQRGTSKDTPLEFGLPPFGDAYLNSSGTIDGNLRLDPVQVDWEKIVDFHIDEIEPLIK